MINKFYYNLDQCIAMMGCGVGASHQVRFPNSQEGWRTWQVTPRPYFARTVSVLYAMNGIHHSHFAYHRSTAKHTVVCLAQFEDVVATWFRGKQGGDKFCSTTVRVHDTIFGRSCKNWEIFLKQQRECEGHQAALSGRTRSSFFFWGKIKVNIFFFTSF